MCNFLGLIGGLHSPFEKTIAGIKQWFKGRKECLMNSILVYDERVEFCMCILGQINRVDIPYVYLLFGICSMAMIFFKPRLSNVWKREISKIKSFFFFLIT